MVRRIHDATIALVSLDRQMIGRLAYVVVPDFMYLEYRSLYLELKPFRDFHGRVPPIVRHHTAATSAAAPVVVARSRGRLGSGLKGSRTERMVEQLAEFKEWLRDNPVNERIAARASEADQRRVPTGERGKQITAVRKLIRKARDGGEEMSILRACRAVWRDVNGGYPSPEALYDYCHSHKDSF